MTRRRKLSSIALALAAAGAGGRVSQGVAKPGGICISDDNLPAGQVAT
jgi:hypothetical protein